MVAPRPIVLIIGSGRSGTSLTMQVLAALGLRTGVDLIPANASNPRGFYEDRAIVRLHADLLRALGTPLYAPLPADWLHTPVARATCDALSRLLRQRLAQTEGPYGIKDPRLSTLYPLWHDVFERLGLQPRVILAVRDPRSVVASLRRHYGFSAEEAEWLWLARNSDALLNSGGRCLVVHYERWFDQPLPLAEALLRHTGLALPDGSDPSAVIADRVCAGLDRSGNGMPPPRNPWVRRLYGALQTHSPAPHDVDALLSLAGDCRTALARATRGDLRSAHARL
jgi:hypothetical protein